MAIVTYLKLIISRIQAGIIGVLNPSTPHTLQNIMCKQQTKRQPRHTVLRQKPLAQSGTTWLLVPPLKCPHIFQLATSHPSIYRFALPMRKTGTTAAKYCVQ